MAENNILTNAKNVAIANVNIQANAIRYHAPQPHIPLGGLDRLFEKSAFSALVDSDARYDAPKCDDGTREAIIQTIMDWIENDEDRASALWLHGSAGSGKSALARAIAELCAARKSLLATFFFTRTRTDRITDGNLLIPTLAYQLAEKISLPRRYIKKCLLQDPSIFHKTREVQMRKLIIKPLNTPFSLLEYHYKRLIQKTPLRLIVIDGLDECFGKDVQRDLLRVLGQAVEELRIPIRFLVASRPEPQIRDSFNDDGVFKTDRLITFNLNDDPNTACDIRTFLEVQFTKILQTHRIRSQIPSPWPSAEDITSLIERASGQFIFVSTVVGYVGSPRHNPVTCLTIITDRLQPPAADAPYGQLDLLYQLIFSSAEESGTDIKKILQVLGTLIIARPEGALDDLYSTYAGIGRVLNLTPGDVALLLDEFVSLIEVPPLESTLPIRILHASLADFLLDPSRSGRFSIDMHQIHGILAVYYSKHTPIRISEMTSFTHRNDLKHHFLPFIMHWKNADIPTNDDDLCDTILLMSEALIFLCHCLKPCEDILWTTYHELLADVSSQKHLLASERNERITKQRPVIITMTSPPILEEYHVLGSLDAESSILKYTRYIGTAGPEGCLVQAVNFGGISKSVGTDEIVLVEIPSASPDRWNAILGWAERLKQKQINLSGILFCQNVTSASDMDWVAPDEKHHDVFSRYQSFCPVALVLTRQGLTVTAKYEWHDLDPLLMTWNRAVHDHGTLLWCKHRETWQYVCKMLMDMLLKTRSSSKNDRHAADRHNTFSVLRKVSIDIQAYLDIQFSSIRNAHGIQAGRPASWPSPEDIATLVERASNQCMYASAVVSYVDFSKHDPVKRLATVVERLLLPTTDAPCGPWYSLYDVIFSSAGELGIDIDQVVQVLGILIVVRPEGARNDLYSTYAGIGCVLNITPNEAILLLDEFISLIELPPLESKLPIRILHESLVGFLLDPSQSGRFSIDMHQIHRVLAVYYSKHTPICISEMTSSTHRDDLKHHFLPFITHWKNADIPANDDDLCGTILLMSEALIFLCHCLKPCEDILWTAYHELLADGSPKNISLVSERNERITTQRPVVLMMTPLLGDSKIVTSYLLEYWPSSVLKRTRRIGTNGPEGSLVRAVYLGGNSKVVGEGEIIVIDIPLVSQNFSGAVIKWVRRLENKHINFSGVLFWHDITSDMGLTQLGRAYHQVLSHCQTLCPIALVLMSRSSGGRPVAIGQWCDLNSILTAWEQAVQVGGPLLWSKYQEKEQNAHQTLWDLLSETRTWKQRRKDCHEHDSSKVLKEIGIDKGLIRQEAWRRALEIPGET